MEKTFAIIKPDAVMNGFTGPIIELIERNQFNILKLKKFFIPKQQAEQLYAQHKEQSFFKEGIDFISSGATIIMVLEKENAIQEWRALIGATDPKKAATGTLRKMFGSKPSANAIHGSDSSAAALFEISLFYNDLNSTIL